MSFFSVVLGYVWLVFGLLRHVVRLSMRFLFWLHQDLSDLCRTSNETYTIGFTRSQLLCLLRESCGRATWPQQQLWIFYFPGRGGERARETERGIEREREGELWIGERRPWTQVNQSQAFILRCPYRVTFGHHSGHELKHAWGFEDIISSSHCSIHLTLLAHTHTHTHTAQQSLCLARPWGAVHTVCVTSHMWPFS